ncbi:MAG: histidine kinase, partial [Nocardioidaceae bacterium]
AQRTALLADVVVQPALTDGITAEDPAAVAALDRAVRGHVLGPSNVRVKVWSTDGTIVYSDEPALIGRHFRLDDEQRDALRHPVARAEVSDLEGPENEFERGRGPLLEVYRPVWTPGGEPLLFETYAPYEPVTARAGQLWRGFAGITLSSLLALIALLVPIVWRLLVRLRQGQDQRERLLERAVQASSDERRRIAGTLHDGVIQDLAGVSLVVTGAARRSEEAGQPELASQLRTAADTTRRGITGLRTLLVDIYPPNLETSGLVVTLEDLASSLHARGIEVLVETDPRAADGLDAEQERLMYRVAHECLLNTVRHASATRAWLSLSRDGRTALLEVGDDGCGFDAAAVAAAPQTGHFGVRLLVDAARSGGARLSVRTGPGGGTLWCLALDAASGPPAGSARSD